jgi:hypothetical protein
LSSSTKARKASTFSRSQPFVGRDALRDLGKLAHFFYVEFLLLVLRPAEPHAQVDAVLGAQPATDQPAMPEQAGNGQGVLKCFHIFSTVGFYNCMKAFLVVGQLSDGLGHLP